MTPIPPACAIAIASALSVTVSIAAEISGMPSSISRVSRVAGIGLAGHDRGRRRDEHHVVKGQSLPNFHRRLLSDGDALYTTTPPQEEIGADLSGQRHFTHDLVIPPLLCEAVRR